MELDLDTLEEPKVRWLDCGGVEFLIKYATPKESEQFRKRLVQMGVARMHKGEFEVVAGREQAWFKALAEQYVQDWRGNIKASTEEGRRYSADKMAIVLANRGDVLRLITESIAEADAFFTRSGGKETVN